MANDNYAAWEIDASEYSEDWDDMAKLRFFCRYAVLAPSSHNTQPWRFSHRDRALIVKHDHRRLLGYSGPMAAEPHVSLGSCLETLRLAAQGFGHRVAVDYDPSAGPVATAVLSGRVDAEASLPSAIVRRTSNRHRYKLEQLSTTLLDQVTSNDLQDAQPHVVTEASDIAFLADQTEVATRQIMSDPQFRAELSDWVRSNITKRFDGMPGFVQGMPTPPSLIARQIIKRVDISKGQAKKDAGRIVNSPLWF